MTTAKSDTPTITKAEAKAAASAPATVDTIESLGVGPLDPYPEGKPQDPEDQFAAAHGFRRAK